MPHRYLVISEKLEEIKSFRELTCLDLSCCKLGDEHELLEHLTNEALSRYWPTTICKWIVLFFKGWSSGKDVNYFPVLCLFANFFFLKHFQSPFTWYKQCWLDNSGKWVRLVYLNKIYFDIQYLTLPGLKNDFALIYSSKRWEVT